MSPNAIFNGGINIADTEQDGKNYKNLHIDNIPSDLYWAIVGLKARLRSETWLDFLTTILSSQIDTKNPFVSTNIEPIQRVYMSEIPIDTFNALKELKATFEAKTWLEFLAVLATANIKPKDAARQAEDEEHPEALP